MEIRGERVNLRDARLDDYADLERWFAPGQEWQKWDAPWEPLTPPDSAAWRRWVERLAEALPDPRIRLEIETAGGRHIGWVNSYWIDEATRWRDCGICIAEQELWGRGLGHEAFALWVGYQLEAFDLPRMGIGTWSGNERMVHLAARIGMREEARFRDAREVNGRRYDAVRWGITRADWMRYQAPHGEGLRRYTPGDWGATVELARQLYDVHRSLQGAPSLTSQDGREILVHWLARRDTVLWVWQEAEKVLGLARARLDGVHFLEEFVIAEGCHGQGVGTRFLAALEEQLRAEGERDVFLSIVWPGNPRAIDFYRRHGYDLLNSFELRKGLERDRRGREIELLGRRFFLGDTVPQRGKP